ncbi:hypothetical protein [Vallitalea guaymasensis]|uniref:hypothetical protein n=1 Tax=Vallitalea guaymasensis TaxID=1185412 RepID=UPI000DE3FABE|nr:hypothetical protein [Vallitalea guaymasensis]
MRDKRLIILIFIPFVFGYLTNLVFLVPGVGTLTYSLMPFVLLIYWFWVGIQFSKSSIKNVYALIYGNILCVLSLLLYYWQFILLGEEKRSMILASISQMYVSPLSPITARFGIMFEKLPNVLSQTSITAMHTIGTILLVITFLAGFIFEKIKHSRLEKVEVDLLKIMEEK